MAHDPFRQRQLYQFAPLSGIGRFKRGGCTAEDDCSANKLPQLECHVAGVIHRGAVLLVGPLMLFVEHNQAEIPQGAENR